MASDAGSEDSGTCRLTIQQERLFRRLEEFPRDNVMGVISMIAEHEQEPEQKENLKQASEGPAEMVRKYLMELHEKGTTFTEISRVSGVSLPSITMWLQGQRDINAATLDRICRPYYIVAMTTQTGDVSEHMPNMWQLMGEGSEMGVSALLKENEELRERCKMLSRAHSELLDLIESHVKDMRKLDDSYKAAIEFLKRKEPDGK